MTAAAARLSSPLGAVRVLRSVLTAHFLGSLADNALLALAIALLESRQAPGWTTPALRISFYAAYVLLAPLAGPLADRFDKARLMTAVNVLKLAGCVGLAAGAHPVLVFGSIGLGAAAYAPARYGILPELVEGRALLRANAAMEIVSIVAILAGVALGALMVAGSEAWHLSTACALLALLYAAGAASAAIAGMIQAVRLPRAFPCGGHGFSSGLAILLRDPDARVSLAITSLFWATAAVLQFMMIDWARRVLGLGLAAASMLPAVLAIGMVGGALAAGRWVHDRLAFSLLPLGVVLGAGVVLMPFVGSLWCACLLLFVVGACAGILLVPMNAVLQQRGTAVLAPGLSVALQNCMENGLSLAFLAAYGLALACAVAPDAAIFVMGGAVTLAAVGIAWRRPAPGPSRA